MYLFIYFKKKEKITQIQQKKLHNVYEFNQLILNIFVNKIKISKTLIFYFHFQNIIQFSKNFTRSDMKCAICQTTGFIFQNKDYKHFCFDCIHDSKDLTTFSLLGYKMYEYYYFHMENKKYSFDVFMVNFFLFLINTDFISWINFSKKEQLFLNLLVGSRKSVIDNEIVELLFLLKQNNNFFEIPSDEMNLHIICEIFIDYHDMIISSLPMNLK